MVKNNSFRILKDYIKFRMQSVNAHGLHSPFMYHLATKCFYDKTKYDEYRLLHQYNRALLNDNTIIKVTDLGAGSKVFHSDDRKIKEIAKVSGSSLIDMKLLFRLTRYFKPDKILELGTSLGKSAFAMSLGNPGATIYTVEGSESISLTAQQYLNKFKANNVQVTTADFDVFLDRINTTNIKFDMIYLDGNHQKEATLRYFDKLLPHIHNDTFVILDDIYWSQEMKEAWQTLIKRDEVRQSIDTFHLGFLFFRKEQFREDFLIRLGLA